MKILGIDYGLKNVGLALAEDFLAEPLTVLSLPSKKPSVQSDTYFLKKIVKICRDKKVEKIVLGIPTGKMASLIKKFSQKLSKSSGLPVVLQDETLTSWEAAAKMAAAGKKLKKRRSFLDAAAAAQILQDYLDKNV